MRRSFGSYKQKANQYLPWLLVANSYRSSTSQSKRLGTGLLNTFISAWVFTALFIFKHHSLSDLNIFSGMIRVNQSRMYLKLSSTVHGERKLADV